MLNFFLYFNAVMLFLEREDQALNKKKKISQLNSAIDDVSSRLRGGKNVPSA